MSRRNLDSNRRNFTDRVFPSCLVPARYSSLGHLAWSACGGFSVVSSAQVQSLLRAAPWLRKYGTLLAERLVQLGVNHPDQIIGVDQQRFAALPDAGKGAVLDLLAAQREASKIRSRGRSSTAPVALETWVREIAAIREQYPVRLLNSLGKSGANTVGQVLGLSADAFAETHGVGAEQVRLFEELQKQLRELLSHPPSSDECGADGSQESGAPDGSLPFDDQPIDGIWEIWSDLPVGLRNCLGIHGIQTVAQVVEMEPAEFARLRGVGVKRVQRFVELRESLRLRRLQQNVEAPHASPPDAALGSPTCPAGEPTPETVEAWESLDALLRDVAACVSANRTHTAEKKRNLEIWLSYHGLGPAPVDRTLDAVGAVYGLTRERVRQIVTRLTRIVGDEIARSSALAQFREALRQTMARCLGVLRAEDLARIIAEEMDWEQPPPMELVRTLDEVLRSTPLAFGYRRGEGTVQHPDACTALRARVVEKAEAILQEIHESEHILDFVYRLTQACRNGRCERPKSISDIPCCGSEKGEAHLPREYVTAILADMVPCPLDGDRVWGYWWTRLRVRRPKTEAMRAALHILGQPVHYSELVEFIGKHNPAFDRANERYVAGQLASSDEYVCTGEPGVYGLREWGGARFATVEDRVEELLRERGGTMHQRGICRNLGAQGVSRASVHAALRDARFVWGADGWVRLVDEAAAPSPVLISSGPVPVLIGDDEDAGYIL